jgi:hypothetical protein
MPPVVVRWITPEARFYSQWDFWLSIFTLLLVVATLLVVFETHRMRTSSDTSMREMLQHAEASAGAANASAEAAQALVNLGERAWVTVREYAGSWSNYNDLVWHVKVVLTNSGHTPALNVEIWQDSRIGTGPDNNFPEVSDNKKMVAGVIGPSNVFEVPIEIDWASPDIPIETQNKIRNGDLHLYIYGMVKYRDIFGAEHATAWCFKDEWRRSKLLLVNPWNYAN